jgi:hypothetical protein
MLGERRADHTRLAITLAALVNAAHLAGLLFRLSDFAGRIRYLRLRRVPDCIPPVWVWCCMAFPTMASPASQAPQPVEPVAIVHVVMSFNNGGLTCHFV